MRFTDNPEEAAFRADVRSFIDENLPKSKRHGSAGIDGEPDEDVSDEDFIRRWRRALVERRWIAPHWPAEYGGAGLSIAEQFIFNEEMAEARAPANLGGAGVAVLGPTLILHGSQEQRDRFLPRIAAGEMVWCNGSSEPGAGSDLASLQTRAVRDGDHYTINGQKIWTSRAHRADWMFMVARTNPNVPKHRGISMFLLDMKTPGITVSPLVNLTGEHGFNQVFFDDVRVPVENRIGEEDRGWYMHTTLLNFERSQIGQVIDLRHRAEDLLALWRTEDALGRLHDRAGMRHELAERRIEAEVAIMFSRRVIAMQKANQVPIYEASMNKNFRSEVQQRIARTAMRLLGPYGSLGRHEPLSPDKGEFAHQYLFTLCATIAGGTAEIHRNNMAVRGLGMPRD
jgi:alkylation response protein AidB-like acyl-CoA dehydrogenase